MLALALGLSLLATPQDSPRLRTMLPNGSVSFAERFERASVVSVRLVVSSRGTEDTPTTHGFRHLLEHFLARGAGDLDVRLESRGAFLSAQTLRDVMTFEVQCAPGDLDLALGALREVAQAKGLPADENAIAKEVRIIRHELRDRGDGARLAAAAWELAYGPAGLDPNGDPERMATATVDQLRGLAKEMFTAPNVTLAVAGPIDIDAASANARAFLLTLPRAPDVPHGARPTAQTGQVTVPEAYGDTAGILVGGVREPRTMAALAAALALAGEIDGAFVSYTPSLRPGLITIGSVRPGGSLELKLAEARDPAALFSRGTAMARRWIDAQVTTPSGSTQFRGMLMSLAPDLRPETLQEALAQVTYPQFEAVVQRIRTNQYVRARGVR